MIKNIFFFCVSFGLILTLAIGHTWLGWSTFEWNGDTSVMALMDMGGWHPVIISLMLKFAYIFTGYHMYTFLLLQVIPFYLSLFIFVWAIYRRWRTVFALLFIVPFYTIQFYLMPLQLMSSSFSIVWVMLLYALAFYGVLNPDFKSKWTKIPFYTITGVVFIIALLSRHNAIMMVWPITIVWIGMCLNKKDYKFFPYLWRIGVGSFFSGIICLCLLIGLNKSLAHCDLGGVYPANSTILAQIVGSCIPDDDSTCFKDEWWSDDWRKAENKMEDLRRLYTGTPTSGDAICASWRPGTPFKYFVKLDGLYEKWFYAVTTHTENFYAHLNRYYEVIWNTPWNRKEMLKTRNFRPKNFEEFSYYAHPISPREKAERHEIIINFPLKELKYKWGIKERVVADFVSDYLLMPETMRVVIANFILFGIAMILWLFKRKNTLILYFLAMATAGVLSNLLIPLFTPATWARYTYPFFVCATIAGNIFVILLCLQLPYLKKFVVEKIKIRSEKKVKDEK